MSKKTGGNKLHTNYQYKHVGGKRKTLKRSKPNTRKSKKTKKTQPPCWKLEEYRWLGTIRIRRALD